MPVKDCHFQLTAYIKECVESYLSIKKYFPKSINRTKITGIAKSKAVIDFFRRPKCCEDICISMRKTELEEVRTKKELEEVQTIKWYKT